jgi:hypothetical protein
MHKASKVFTLQNGNSLDKWQILRFEDLTLRFELEFEFPFYVIIKAVLRRRMLVFNGRPMRLAKNFTQTAKNIRNIDFFFGSEKFSRPTFATPTYLKILNLY